MKFDPLKHHRRSIRLKGYDYAQPGAYFVTLVAWQRDCLFGEIVDGVMRLNPAGQIIQVEWRSLPRHFPNIRLDAFVVMPNHFHGIIIIDPTVGANHLPQNDSWSGNGSLPYDPPVGMIGSHIPADEMRLASGGGATRPSPDEIHDGKDPMPDEARDIAFVGATRPSPDEIFDGKNPMPDEARVSNEGSPLQPAARPNGPPAGSLGAMIGQFKSRATKRIWALPGIDRVPVWQRNYYEHIIRNDLECQRFIEYIQANPQRWQEDQLHPSVQPNPYNQE